MPKTRPTSITVIAVLQLIFGGIMVLLYICGGVYQLLGGQELINRFMSGAGNNPQVANQMQMQKEFQEGLEKTQADLPGGKPFQYASLGVDVLLSAMMIVGGIGLLKMRRWSYTLTIFYAALSILMKIVSLIFVFMYAIPALSAYLKEFGAKGQDQRALAAFGQIGVYVAPVQPIVLAIYPIIVLVIMLLPRNRAAFRAETVAPVESSSTSEHIQEDDRWGRG